MPRRYVTSFIIHVHIDVKFILSSRLDIMLTVVVFFVFGLVNSYAASITHDKREFGIRMLFSFCLFISLFFLS